VALWRHGPCSALERMQRERALNSVTAEQKASANKLIEEAMQQKKTFTPIKRHFHETFGDAHTQTLLQKTRIRVGTTTGSLSSITYTDTCQKMAKGA